MKKLKHALVISAMIGSLCILPATLSQAGAVEMPSGNVLVAAKGGHGSGSGPGSGSNTPGGPVSNSPGSGPGSPDSRSNASPASGKHNPSQNQTQTTERVETRPSAPDKVNGRQANRVMENALGTLKQIREQTMDQARMGEKWQELRGQINQIKEQRKLRQLTGEEAKIMLRDCLDLAKEQQNLEEQENLLKDLVEIDPADKEAYKELGRIYRMREKNGIKVFSNGIEIKFDVPPVIKEGRTLIPVRALTEGFGATVSYDAENQTVTVTKGETTIVLTLGQNVALVNGREVTLDAKAELNNNRTIVPLRFIAETFKLNVDNPDEDIVTVNEPTTDTTTENNTGDTTGSSTETSAGTTGGETAEEGTTQNTASQNTTTNPQQP